MLGSAAVTIWCEVEPGVRPEFDDWHTHEHLPERLAIPGFLRGTRWTAADGGTGIFILYEVADLSVLTSAVYLERLNNPTPWSRKMMPSHMRMVRGLCRVQLSTGSQVEPHMQTIRLSPRQGGEGRLEAWLAAELPKLSGRAHLLRNVATPALGQTTEQRIRGGDGAPDWVVLENHRGAVPADSLGEEKLVAQGAAPGSILASYVLASQLTSTAVS
jgi:hypothetical protein